MYLYASCTNIPSVLEHNDKTKFTKVDCTAFKKKSKRHAKKRKPTRNKSSFKLVVFVVRRTFHFEEHYDRLRRCYYHGERTQE